MWTLLIPSAFLTLILISTFSVQSAFAGGSGFQGGGQPHITSTPFESIALSMSISPVMIVNGSSSGDITIQFRVYDSSTNETKKYPTLYVNITDEQHAKPVIADLFQGPQGGTVIMKFHTQAGQVQVRANRDPFSTAAVTDPAGQVTVAGPVFVQPGIYHIKVRVFGFDTPANIFTDSDVKTFDNVISVGDRYKTDVQFGSKIYPVTIISHSAKIQDFKFNAASKTFSWEIPFDWNMSRIEKSDPRAITIREEVTIPKSFPGAHNETSIFYASVNGNPITSPMLAVDQFSNASNITLRIEIDKIHILEMAKNYDDNNSTKVRTMRFSLSPSPLSTSASLAGTQQSHLKNLPSIFAAGSNDTSADSTWYVGKGAKPDTYVKYAINSYGTNYNQTFIMTIYFQQYNTTGKYWIAPVYVFDNPSNSSDNSTASGNSPHLIKGRFLLKDEDLDAIQDAPIIPPQLVQYRDAYTYSLDWLSRFATKSFSPSLTAFYWNLIGAPDLFELPLLRHTENVTVPAGTFNTTVINWHRGPSHDNRIWINKDFPYPIKARVYAEVVNPPAQIQYEFELLEYGKGRPDVSTITSSNGSTIVIPEFPVGALLPIVASIISVIILMSKRKLC